MKAIKDGLTVQVRDGDIEAAARLLKRRMATDGTLRLLKVRHDNPKAVDRKRVKAARAARHRKRYHDRRAATDSSQQTK